MESRPVLLSGPKPNGRQAPSIGAGADPPKDAEMQQGMREDFSGSGIA